MRFMIIAIASILVAGSSAVSPCQADVDVSFGFFYSNLSRHGEWVVSAEYGRVWQPAHYHHGWHPYHDGHWVWTDLGWAWVSDYAWGGIPYHYGTWVLDPAWGWVWLPGYTWAPSWVAFRTGPDFIGWTPVPPGFTVGASIELHDDPDLFVFVGAGDFLAPRIRTRVVRVNDPRRTFSRTRIVNNFSIENEIVVNRGLEVNYIERVTKKRVRRQPIEQVRRAAPGDRVSRADLRVGRRPDGHGARTAPPVPRDAPTPRVDHGRHGKSDGKTSHGADKSRGKKKRDDRRGM